MKWNILIIITICYVGSACYSFGAESAESLTSPVSQIADRDVYYPGTEALGPDEMRVIACGTGMPNARPKQSA